MDEKKEKPEDDWDYDNIDKTIESRKTDMDGIIGSVKAMDSHLNYKIAEILKKYSGEGTIKYTILEEGHKDYNEKAKKEVEDLVDKVYDVNSDIHPLKDVLSGDMLKNNYFNKKMIDGIYTPHKNKIKQSVGKKDFMAIAEDEQTANFKKLNNELFQHSIEDINPDKHGDGWMKYLIKEHNLDEEKIHKDSMRRNIQNYAFGHITRQFNKDKLYSEHHKYLNDKKTKEEK
ncbi:MAG: hypothetical protein ABIC91_00800 [Nanoarchaeota archaeon]|nr:hypothetical protein [Nanoarchaeota archaeon]MBU1029910.1 hypothetical protein [Nanoarchaeota archaeon]MBU1850400.1 hypothetical protein [Nanoarchaeota archaeon]